MTSSYPRVLIVTSDQIGSLTGTGVTLTNLFGSWPREALAELHFSDDPVRSEGVRKEMRFPAGAVPADYLVRRLMRGRRPQFADGASKVAGVPLPPNASAPARRHAALRSLLDVSPVLPSRRIEMFVENFRPDIVYSLLGSVRVIRVATQIARRWQIPLVPHFMDDWPETLYSSGELHGWAQRHLRRQLVSALALAPFALCISPAMCNEYQRRYELRCHPFVNPVRLQNEPALSAPTIGQPELLYVGGLQLGRWETLLQLGEAMVEAGVNARLTVYAPPAHLRGLEVPPGLVGTLTLAGSLATEDVAPRLTEADVLVHVESLLPQQGAFARYSLSTKVPQYLGAGRPVLAIGAPGLASLETIEESSGGIVVTSTDRGVLGQAVTALLGDGGRREEYGRAGRIYAAKHFAVEPVRERFREVLASAVTA